MATLIAATAVTVASAHTQTTSTSSTPAKSSSVTTAKTTTNAKAHATASTRSKTPSPKHRPIRSAKFVPKQKAPTPDRISEIQSALARGGYYQSEPNGKWDPDTVAAMQKFQSANGIEPSGKLDAPSLQKLGLGSDIAGVAAPKPLANGSESPASTPAQEAPRGTGQSQAASRASSNSSAPSTAASIAPTPPAIASKSTQQ